MSCGKGVGFKQGDTIPLSGRIRIQEWDEDNGEYVDISAVFDFSLWSIEAEVKDLTGAKVADFNPTIGTGGVYTGEIPSAASAALPVGKYRYDVRFKDEGGRVQSTGDRTFEIYAAQSEVPA